jgi:hypothetical protein
MHYIYNKNVIEIEGRNWNPISPNQFDRWCGVAVELSLLAFNMKNGVLGVFESLFFLKEKWCQKTHNMVFLC